jgi:hypothetical protein
MNNAGKWTGLNRYAVEVSGASCTGYGNVHSFSVEGEEFL